MRSTFDSDEITSDFITKIRKTQSELRRETSMNLIEIEIRKQIYNQLQNTYFIALSEHKNHYMIFFLILRIFKNKDKFNLLNITSQSSFEEIHTKLPTINALLDFAENINNSFLVDALTFLILPSYFGCFRVKFLNTKLNLFFLKIKNTEKFNLYARILFCSPYFIDFINEALQPVLSHFLADKSNNIQNLKTEIISKWRFYQFLIPSYIKTILSLSLDREKTLSESFFEIALTNINENTSFSQMYGLVGLNQPIPNEKMKILRDILTIQNKNNSILYDLSNLILERNDEPENFFTEEDKNNAPSLFQPVLLSKLESEIIKLITQCENVNDLNNFDPNKQFINPELNQEYSLYLYFQENEEKKESELNQIEQTMAKDSNFMGALIRHLLQTCDPIPIFNDIPDDLTVESFFDQYLVLRGPLETLSQRIEMKNAIFCQTKVVSKITSYLDQALMNRIKEVKALTAFDTIKDKIDFTYKISKIHVQTLIIYDSIKIFNIYKFNYPIKTYKYYTNPNLLEEDFVKFVNTISSYTQYSSIIAYSYLTRKFNFQDFLNTHSKLEIIDNDIHQRISNINLSNIHEKHSNGNNEEYSKLEDFNIDQWLKVQLNLMSNNQYFTNIINDAFRESNPMRKCIVLEKLLQEIEGFLYDNLPYPGKELGKDKFFPFEYDFFLSTNPPNIFSNYIFLKIFCFQPNEFYQLLQRYVANGYSITELILKNMNINIDKDFISDEPLSNQCNLS